MVGVSDTMAGGIKVLVDGVGPRYMGNQMHAKRVFGRVYMYDTPMKHRPRLLPVRRLSCFAQNVEPKESDVNSHSLPNA